MPRFSMRLAPYNLVERRNINFLFYSWVLLYLRLAMMLLSQTPQCWDCPHEPTCSVRNTFLMLNSCLLQDAYIYTMYIPVWKICCLHSVAMETLPCRGQISERDEDWLVQNSHSACSFQPLEHLAIAGCIWSTPVPPAPSMCGSHASLLLISPNTFTVLQIAGINKVLRESLIV